jgi:hypothetical protein
MKQSALAAENSTAATSSAAQIAVMNLYKKQK